MTGIGAITEAARDYRWLLDRGYPDNGSITLVGDRYRLNRHERHMLYRGVSSAAAAARRAARLVTVSAASASTAPHTSPATFPATATQRYGAAQLNPASVLGIDGHNVLLTVANYLHGIPTFECDDGLIRDIGGVHGRVRDEAVMHRAIRLLAESVASLGSGESPASNAPAAPITSVQSGAAGTIGVAGPPDPPRTDGIGTIVVFLDAPVSHSREHAGCLRDALEAHTSRLEVTVVPSADAALRAATIRPAAAITVLATSDSALIDTTMVPVFDLARYVIEHHFSPAFESFRTILPLSS